MGGYCSIDGRPTCAACTASAFINLKDGGPLSGVDFPQAAPLRQVVAER
jgi:hypothetical protein